MVTDVLKAIFIATAILIAAPFILVFVMMVWVFLFSLLLGGAA